MEFIKMHGAGNDFVMVDARDHTADWADLAVRMCDRHFGIGSDGLCLIQSSDLAEFRFRMFNPDGSEAEMCGNGIRCFAKYLADERLVSASTESVRVETGAGILVVGLVRNGNGVEQVRVDMGKPLLQAAEVPVDPGHSVESPVKGLAISVGGVELSLTCVSMGNPHAVAFIDTPVDDFPLERIGPLVERHPHFPRRTNFEIANVIDRGHLKMRVWERGAGITLACGTGACGTAVAAQLNGLTDQRIVTSLPGGDLIIEWDGRNQVFMTGPAQSVFRGNWML